MKHTVRFQYRPQSAARPHDHEQAFDISTESGPVLLPEIGDHVEAQGDDTIRGVVENRTFLYLQISSETVCKITIVVTDIDVDAGRLMKD